MTPTWSGSSDIKQRIDAGEAFDLVIVGAPDIDAFVKDGKLTPGSRVDIASTGVGMAVKAGAPKPNMSSGEAVRKHCFPQGRLHNRLVRAAFMSRDYSTASG